MKRFLPQPNRPTVIFARSNFAVIGAITAIREADLRIPQDADIIEFNDIPPVVQMSPPLSTKENLGKINQKMRLKIGRK